MPDEDILSAKKREGHTIFGMKNVPLVTLSALLPLFRLWES